MNQFSGCLLINKKIGTTSREEVNTVSKSLGIKKCGHIGTLDPFASGLLIILVNKATKLSPFLECKDKTYIAKIKFGEATDTGDLDGKIIEKSDVPNLTKEQIIDVLNSFLGDSEQLPPMFSALKYNGKHYYDYARKGMEIERKPRKIHIYDIKFLSYENNCLTFVSRVSKGTYLRTLGEDIAKKLNTVGHLIALERTSIGRFLLKDAIFSEDASINKLLSIDEVLSDFPSLTLNEKDAFKAINGVKLNLNIAEETILVKDKDGIIAMYQKEDGNIYHCLRGLR